MCVLSIDGVIAFFEQESFSVQVYLPNFLLPAPMKYVPSTDTFLVSTADRRLESFRYNLEFWYAEYFFLSRPLSLLGENRLKDDFPSFYKLLQC